MPEASYASQKSRLLKDFDRMVARVKRVVISRYGEEQAKALIRESRREYESLIPQIPYIGEKSIPMQSGWWQLPPITRIS